jgi:hypothetical protein
MIKYECIFRGGKAGYLETADPVDRAEKKCRFMPYRSKAHLRLAELVHDNKRPVAILKSEQHSVEVEIVSMSPDLITVKKKETANKNSFFRKLFPFSRK